MSAALHGRMSLDEFLVWEACQELRFEFDGIQPVAMTGGTARHEIIGGNLRAALLQRLRNGPFRAWGPTAKIMVQGRIRYPDAFVTCGEFAFDATVIPDPVVVFEVLSAGTSRTDRIEKLQGYQATPSIRRYVLIEQDTIAATIFWRLDELWAARVISGGDVLSLPEVRIELPLADLYGGAGLPQATEP